MTTIRKQPRLPESQTSFEQHARQVLAKVRDTFAAVVEALPERATRPSDLMRALNVDRKLAWRLSKVVQSHDPFALVEHLPGSAGVVILLNAAARRGVPAPAISAAHAAYQDFEQLITVHAGDRTSLEMMAQAFSRETSDQSELAHRKAAFQGNSYTWGVQARTQLSVNIIAPSTDPANIDIALISGLIDLRRLRPKVAWVVARTGFITNEGKTIPAPPPDATPEQKRAARDAYRVPLVREFCSSPLPDLRAKLNDSGLMEIELVEGPVGEKGAITCVFSGPPFRNVEARGRSEDESKAHLNAHIRTPSTMLIHDLLVHHERFGPLTPEVSVYSEVHREVRSAATRDDRYRLPVRLNVEYLGRGPTVIRTPDVPRYPQLVRHVCGLHNWNAEDFDVYRLVMSYPIVPSAVVISFEVPELPPASNTLA